MQIEYLGIDDIIPYANNPRHNDGEAVERVAASIKEYGFKNPLIIDKDNVIVAGHTRYKAAKRLGIDSVPTIKADDLTPAQIKAFRLADNKVAEYSSWNNEMLAIELEELQELDFDLDLTGFEDLEIESLLNEDESEEAKEDDFDVELPKEPKSKQGEVYRLGNHYLMCGDSTSVEDVEKLTNGVKMDMLITDPPYNVAYEGGTKDKLTIQNDNMESEQFRAFLTNAFYVADTVMKNGAVFYIWHADSEGYNFRGACKDVGWQIRQCLIWKKSSMVIGRQDYQWKHEPCLYGWKSGASHLWASDRKQTTILEFDKPLRNAEHPTMKPIALFDYQIKNNTKQEDTVLDLFAGSGTTLIACEQNGRISYNMELDPRYVDVCINRYIELKGSSEDVYRINPDGTMTAYKEVLENVEAA